MTPDVVPAGFEPLFRTSPFLEALGPVYCRRDGSGLALGLRIAEKHTNARGLAHGGVLVTLCDVALGYSAAYSQDPPLSLTTAQISADFAGSARIGDWVESSADIQRIGGRLAFVNVYLAVGSTRRPRQRRLRPRRRRCTRRFGDMKAPKPIAYVQAAWHTEITEHCKEAFVAEMTRHGYPAGSVEFFSTPGSLELPLMAKKLAKSGRYAAVCASGLVLDGGIYRHDFVAQAVLQGIVQTSLETEVPVLSAVLTPHHFHEHAVHVEFFKQHMQTKGKELAEACVSIVEKLAGLEAVAEDAHHGAH